MKLAIMQGRLSPMVNRKIQSFPIKNWKKEFSIAKKIGLKFIEWTLDYQHLFLNPLLTKKGKKEIKFFSKKYSIKIKSLTGDCFMQRPFWKLKNNSKLILNFKKIINCCGEIKIKYIVVPLVDKGSIKIQIKKI